MTYDEFYTLKNKKNIEESEKRRLEPYRVKRAVLMAAGLGTRLRPLTEKVPKPLVQINGIRLIDTVIDALLANDITEIYVIRGYLADQFDELLEKYPFIHFINNFLYDKGNNITSVCTAGNLIANAFVAPADLFVLNKDIFCKYQYCSNVLGYKVEETDDWCIEVKNNIVKRLSPGGKGANCYKDIGVFYWNAVDGTRLYKQIYKTCMTPEGLKRYWSNVPFELYKESYEVHIRTCNSGDVWEIDTVDELRDLERILIGVNHG